VQQKKQIEVRGKNSWVRRGKWGLDGGAGRGRRSAARQRPARARAHPCRLTHGVGSHPHRSACDSARGRPRAARQSPSAPTAGGAPGQSGGRRRRHGRCTYRVTNSNRGCTESPCGRQVYALWTPSASVRRRLLFTRSRGVFSRLLPRAAGSRVSDRRVLLQFDVHAHAHARTRTSTCMLQFVMHAHAHARIPRIGRHRTCAL